MLLDTESCSFDENGNLTGILVPEVQHQVVELSYEVQNILIGNFFHVPEEALNNAQVLYWITYYSEIFRSVWEKKLELSEHNGGIIKISDLKKDIYTPPMSQKSVGVAINHELEEELAFA